MKRIVFSLLLTGAISLVGYAQQSVSIGTDQINSNAVLWLQGNGSQGLILPVVTNRTGVNATKGMIVFDDSDKKVYYNSGTAWVEVGGGGAGVAQTLTLSGNTLSISSGNSVQISGTAPTTSGQLLQWNGTQWTSSNATAPVTGEVLKWNGTSWAPGTDNAGGASIILADGQLLTGNGTTNAATTITGDVTLSGSALTIANDAVNSAKIADGSIVGADLNNMSATNGQVLKYNGTTWAPAADDAGVGATPTLSNGQILIGDGSNNTATALSGDATINGGALTIANNAINSVKIADGSITTADIADGTIQAADLNSMSAINGQVLQFNGTLWNPATLSGSGTVTNVSGTGPISVTTPTTTPVISISQANASTNGFLSSVDWALFSAKLGAASTTSGDLSGTVINPTVVGIQGRAVTNAVPTNGQILKFNGTTWAPAADDVGGGATPTLSNGQILIGDGTNNSGVALSGDATLSAGSMTIANDAINSTKIADGSIQAADLNAMGATANQILQYNGSAWAPAILPITSGTVTSVGLAMPSIFSVAGSPVTTSGVMTTTLVSQPAATVFAAPTGAAGAPTFRTLAATDIPNIDASKITTGTLPIAQGGTGATTPGAALANLGAMNNTLNAGELFVGNASNIATGVPMSGDGTMSSAGTFAIATGVIVDADVNAAAAIAGTKVNPNFGAQTITTTGTINTGGLSTTGTNIFGALASGGNRVMVAASDGTIGAVNNTAGVLTNDGVGGLTWATSSAWGLTGNAGTNPAANFIGTTDANNLSFRQNNVERMVLSATGLMLSTGGSFGIGGFTALRVDGANDNIFVGPGSGVLTTGASNVFMGANTGGANGGGIRNTFIGTNAGFANTNGARNTFLGSNTGTNNTTGIENVFIGDLTGQSNTSGNNITLVGRLADVAIDGLTNATAIGAGAIVNTSDRLVLGAPGTAIQFDGDLRPNNLPGTAGQVLTSQGPGVTPTWAAAGGSFNTLNTIPKGDGSTLVASSIFDDGTNVGIGSVSPLVKLSVRGKAYIRGDGNTPSDGDTFTPVYDLTIDDNDTGFDVPADGELVVYANSLEQMRFALGGVGIGTPTPGAKLDIIGDIKITDGTEGAGKVLTSDANGLASWQAAGGVSLQSAYTGGNTITLAASPVDITGPGGGQAAIQVRDSYIETVDTGDDEDAWFRSTSGTSWLFGANNLVHSGGFAIGTFGNMLFAPFFIEPTNGYVGIGGEVSPSSALDVAGDIEFSGALLPNNLPGTAGQVLTSAGAGAPPTWQPGGLSNPMTTAGDIIFGGAAGLPTRLAPGTIGQVLTATGSGVSWNSPGGNALLRNNGVQNIFVGQDAGINNSDADGLSNTFVGYQAGITNTRGQDNTFIGSWAGRNTDDPAKTYAGSFNTFIGRQTGEANTTGALNTYVGFHAGQTNTTALGNTFIGADAGLATTAIAAFGGGLNTFIGEKAGLNHTNGFQNVIVGRRAGLGLTTGNKIVLLGSDADVGSGGLVNASAIGYQAFVTQNNSMVLGSINGVNGAGTDTNVGIGTTAPTQRLHVIGNILASGTITPSDIRFKRDVNTLKNVLSNVSRINGVSYYYKKEEFPAQGFSEKLQIGVIAQELETVYPELIVTDSKGFKFVDYTKLTPILVEAIKELSKITDQLSERLVTLETENQKLKSENGSLESKVSSIEAQQQSLAKDLAEIKRLLGAEAKK